MSYKRRFSNCVLAVSGLAFLSAFGCCGSHRHCEGIPAGEEMSGSTQLPDGFRPLRGHDNAQDGGDNYNGWPRFIFSQRDRMVMVYVPSQTFTMGGGTQPDEVPARQVRVQHFYIDLHEVTNIQFDCFRSTARFAGAAGSKSSRRCPLNPCGVLADDSGPLAWVELEKSYPGACWSPWCCDQDPGQICKYLAYWTPCVNDNHPVRNVSWCEAWSYSNWSRKQLPSEAQWEAAARGDDRRIYPWGNQDQSEVTRYLLNARTARENFDGYEYTAPVLTYAAGVSPYGAFNMAGNVAEWCGDWYDLGRYGYPSDEDPPTGLQRGPKPFGDRYYPNPWDKDFPEARVGPMRGSERAIRGGSFTDPIDRCRVDVRWTAGPEVHQQNVGFRTILLLPRT